MSVWIDKPTEAENHDDAVRYRVASRSNPHESYLVDLTDYSGNGTCQCKHFQCRLEPLLARMITPEKAVADRLVTLLPKQQVEDALRCGHICEARNKFTTDVLNAINEKTKATRAKENADA